MSEEIEVKNDDVGIHIQQEGEDDMNKVIGVVAGVFGEAITLSVVDAEGLAIDLSAYTAATLNAISPSEETSLQFTVTIVSASGGSISITPSSTNTFTRDGEWLGQIEFTDTGILAYTVPFEILVERII